MKASAACLVFLWTLPGVAAITASLPLTAELVSTDTEKSLGTLVVEADDFVVVLVAANKGASESTSNLQVTLRNGAVLNPLHYSVNAGFGPAVFLWHGKVTTGGEIDLTLANPGEAFLSCAAYTVQATDGETISPMVSSASDNSTTATSITHTYSFAESSTGLVIEAVSTYASEGLTPTGGTTFDVLHQSGKRGVGQGAFTELNAFERSYSLGGANTKVVITGIAFTGAVPEEPPPIASPERTRLHPGGTYNVLFIPIDDMRPLIGAYGETEPLRPLTPHMDRLAESGILFTNAHAQQAVCNASRASVLTGLRPDWTRCWKLDTFFRDQVPGIVTLPQHFGENGYTVHGIGKVYHGTNPTSQDAALSWNDGWASASTGNTYYEDGKWQAEDAGNHMVSATDAGEFDFRNGGTPITDSAYNDGFAAVQGVAKIASLSADYHANGTPFFLAVGFQKPHLPFNCPKMYWDLYDPNDIDLTGYTGIREMPSGTNKFTAPYGGEPKGYDDVTGTSDNGMPTAAEARHLIHGYLACVSFIDAQVGKLLDALEDPDGDPGTEDSVVDHTVVVLWSDHGFHLGDHNGFWAKHSNFEISTRVPLILRSPGMADLGSAGHHTTGLVELVDLYPTLLDLCSLPAPSQPAGLHLQGTTFLPLLEDTSQPWKKAVFTQFQRGIKDTDPGDVPLNTAGGTGMGYSIRTERYRYTEWWLTESTDETDRHIVKAGITGPAHVELYDYRTDPGETTNLASDPAHLTLVSELSMLLNDDDAVSAGDGWSEADAAAPPAYPEDYPSWRDAHSAPGRKAADLDPSGDPDFDQLENLFEYKFGTHPFVPSPSPVSSFLQGSVLSMTYPHVTSRTDATLKAETSVDLNFWNPSGITSSPTGQLGNATLLKSSMDISNPLLFMRLRTTQP
jgi:iduronate 2-sulfatase